MKVKFQGITTEKEALPVVKQNGCALQYVTNYELFTKLSQV